LAAFVAIGLFALFGAARDAEAEESVFYVAPDGSDQNPGTLESPFQTLGRAAEVAAPGTTIFLRGGTYSIRQSVRWEASGLPGEYIQILAYPNEVPILDGQEMTETGYWGGWILDIVDSSWIHLRGLDIRRGPEGGMVMRGESHHNIVESLNVHNNGRLSRAEGKGISLYGEASSNLFLKNDSHHNADIDGDDGDGFQISVSGFGNVLRDNRAWRNSDDGFDFFNIFDFTTAAPVLIEHNYAWENGFDDNLNPIGDGIGFKLGGERPGTGSISGGHIVRYNLSWRNRTRAFDRNGASLPSELYDNRETPTPEELAAAFGPPPAW
jgi:hypothetical protein